MLKSVSIVGLTRFFSFALGDNYVKTNEDTPVLSATKMFVRDSSFGEIRFMRIFVSVLVQGGVN